MSNRILNLASYVGMALVFGAVAVRVLGWTGTVTVSAAVDQYALYAVWAGFALVLLYTLAQVVRSDRRDVRYGALAGVSVLVVLGILIAVNYLSTRQNKRWDLTENKQFSLADQTTQLLKGLTAPMKFLVFFNQTTNIDSYRSRLTEFEYQSKNVSAEYVDAEKNPVRTRQYDVQTAGTVVIEYMGRTERITSDAEQDLTNALIKILNPQKKKAYFLDGHGEKDTASSDRTGYATIATSIKQDNYEFERLVLAQTNAVPADATLLILAGPQTDLLEQEVPILQGYLAKAGKLLVLMDPSDNLKQPTPMPRLSGLLKEWGINATDSIVVDVSGQTSVATVPVAGPQYPAHAITDGLNLTTIFPFARAILPAADTGNRMAQTFVQTTARSWAETTFAQLDDPSKLAPEPDKGDIPGPVSLAVAVAVPTSTPDAAKPPEPKPGEPAPDAPKPPETRVVVIGDSDFASNAVVNATGNRDLFMNSVNWLAQQENLIAIRPREAADRRLTMTPRQQVGMFWLSIVVIPLAVFGIGGLAWWKRR